MLDSFLNPSNWSFSRERSKDIELSFALPPPDKHISAGKLFTRAFTEELSTLKKSPNEQLRLLRREIKSLTRCKLNPKERLDLNTQALTLAHPVLIDELRRYARDGGLPDSHKRQEALDLTSEIFQLIGHSYLAVFKHHYDAPDAHFDRNREELRLCACRFLELARLEQRSRALRYQLLGSNTWYLVNSLFHIMRAYDEVDTELATLDSELPSGHGERKTTLTTVYVAIQLISRLDMPSWPTTFQTLMSGYLNAFPEAAVLASDNGEAPSRYQLVTYCNDDLPAQPRRSYRNEGLRAILIDWSPLAQRLRSDSLNILTASRTGATEHVPKKLQLLSNVERLAFSHLALRGMEAPPLDNSHLESAQAVPNLHIYAGFKDVYQLAGHMLSSKSGLGREKRFVDLFAERSAMIAEDHTTENESLWHVLHQDNRQIRLRTQESRFTKRMMVGSLLAYGTGEQDIKRPRLCVVSRIIRQNNSQVTIDLDRLAKYAEPVTVRAENHPDVMHALLIHDIKLGWNLLFPPQYNLTDSVPVNLIFRGKAIPFELGVLRYVTAEFYSFSVPLSTTDLGLEEVPSYPGQSPESPIRDD